MTTDVAPGSIGDMLVKMLATGDLQPNPVDDPLSDGPISRFIIQSLDAYKIAQHDFVNLRNNWKNNVDCHNNFQDVHLNTNGIRMTVGSKHDFLNHKREEADPPLSCYIRIDDFVVREDIYYLAGPNGPREIAVTIQHRGNMPEIARTATIGEPLRRLAQLPLLLDRVIGWRTVTELHSSDGNVIWLKLDANQWQADSDPALSAGHVFHSVRR